MNTTNRMVRLPLILVILCAVISIALIPSPALAPPDRMISIRYVLTGINGGFPVQTLEVSGTIPGVGSGSGMAVLITAGFNSSATKRLPLTDAELRALVNLFTNNNFSTLDSLYDSGCLSCPDFSITYGKKTVRGNTTGGSVGLANIKAGLDTLLNKVRDATPVASSRDTVVFEPAKPTNLDNITFKLFNFYDCCGMRYINKSVLVTDTAIYLSYEFDDSLCAFVRCIAAGSWTSFQSTPIPAGKYHVYKVASAYCPPGNPCPYMLAWPEYVGPLTVLRSTASRPHQSRLSAVRSQRLQVNGSGIRLFLDQGGAVSIRAFGLDGSLLGTVFKGSAPEGVSRYSLSSLTIGTGRAIIITLTTDGGTMSRTLVYPGNSTAP